VSGTDRVGGLAGSSSSSITNSYATGTVSGTDSVGGLAGDSYGDITNSYATGNVTGQGNYVGGLAGYSSSSITNSYATGTVSGTDRVGGLAGYSSSSITNSYATGTVSGDSKVGGLIGEAVACNDGIVFNVTDSVSYSQVSGNTAVGSLIGSYYGTSGYGWSYLDGDQGYEEFSGELIISNCQALSSNYDFIGGYWKDVEIELEVEDPHTGDIGYEYNYDGSGFVEGYDFTSLYNNITAVQLKPVATNLQVGINNNSSCHLNFDTNFEYDLSAVEDISSVEAFNSINEFLALLSEKSTQLGAIQNRLDSALESIEVNLTNLTSSLSTIRDADIAEVSAEYIQQQILQQAAATLMSTANQSPAIALQLI